MTQIISRTTSPRAPASWMSPEAPPPAENAAMESLLLNTLALGES